MEHKKAIKNRLQEINMTQRTLAGLVNINEDILCKRLGGDTKFTVTEFLRICKTLGLNANTLK